MLGPFERGAFDVPRDGEAEITLSPLELPGVKKAEQGVQCILRSIFGRELRIATENGAHGRVHVGKKRKRQHTLDGPVRHSPFRAQESAENSI